MTTRQAPGQHLTDEQFGDLLAGDTLDSLGAAHLLTCAHCRGEVEAVRNSVSAFQTVSLAWAQAEAPRRVPVPSRWKLRLGARPVWNVALMTTATIVALGVGMQMPRHMQTSPLHTEAVATEPTGDKLAEDNRLLASISKELSDPPQTAVPFAQLKQIPGHGPGHLAEAVAN